MASSEFCSPQFSLIVLLAIFVAKFTDGSDSSKEVYGQLESAVCLDVWDQGSKNLSAVIWMKGAKTVAKFFKFKSSAYGDFKGRAEVFLNGTLRLNPTNGTDAGEYSFEIFNDEGESLSKNKTQLRLLVHPSQGTSKYYFSLLSLIIVVLPFCVWTIKNQWVKRKNEDISICEECIYGRNICLSGNESVLEENAPRSEDALNYTSIIFEDPAKRNSKEIQIANPDHATEYAPLKVKVKNKQLYEDSIHYVDVQPTTYRSQTD